MTLAVSFQDVRDAAARLAGHAHSTPVLTSRTADEQLGARLFFKCENLQRIGAFKFRGGYNAIARLDDAQRRRGVLAFSSGNHAQAIALAARLQGVAATILMPADAPAAKMAATRDYGAEVVTYDRMTQDREALARALASGAVPPPFAPHLTHLLDEAPVPLVVMAVEEAAERSQVPPGRVWRNVAKLAGDLAIHRKALWV